MCAVTEARALALMAHSWCKGSRAHARRLSETPPGLRARLLASLRQFVQLGEEGKGRAGAG